MAALNLGIVAHVDAGKTSLTERLLHAAGVIDEIGSVDDGSTRTDSLALERRRGITIKSAVVSFTVDGVPVNLIDTPGHPDFIAEVERVLSVLDGAILVISAVEGVQAQTRVLMRALQRLRIPTLIFVNKIDRSGARDAALLGDIAVKLRASPVPMSRVEAIGTRAAAALGLGPADPGYAELLTERLAEHDDRLLAAFVADESAVPYARLRRELGVQTGRALLNPVFFGSAITGAGVEALMAGLAELLPASSGDPSAPAVGSIFKVDRGPAGERIGYVRMHAGTLSVREQVRFGADRVGKLTAISVFADGAVVARESVSAGRIGLLRGLDEVRIGDTIGTGAATPIRAARQFPPPTLETVVVPARAADRAALHLSLVQLAEQDPLINLREDDVRREISISLYGEVQKEVVQATLAEDFGVEVTFRETSTICIERVLGTGAAVEVMAVAPNPFLATVGLRVEPAPIGSGVRFGLGIELGALPPAFIRAVEETVRSTLREGLRGWEVPDCAVTLARSGYAPRQSHAHAVFDKSMSSTAGDFRNLTPLVLMAALRLAGTRVCQPMHRFEVEIPPDTFGAVLPVLTRLGAVPRRSAPHGDVFGVEGTIPAARVHALEQRLPGLTRGEGVLETAFVSYQPVRGPAPHRPRTDRNPLDRTAYLRSVTRG